MPHKCCNSYLYPQMSLSQKWLTPPSLCHLLPLNNPKHASPEVLKPAPLSSPYPPASKVLAPLEDLGLSHLLLPSRPITRSTSRAVYLLIASFAITHNNQLRHCQRSTHSRPARLVVSGRRHGVRTRGQAAGSEDPPTGPKLQEDGWGGCGESCVQ